MMMMLFGSGEQSSHQWTPEQCSILSEVGSMQLEFEYLSYATGDPIFAQKVSAVYIYILTYIHIHTYLYISPSIFGYLSM